VLDIAAHEIVPFACPQTQDFGRPPQGCITYSAPPERQ
jgi:hypothetical protein